MSKKLIIRINIMENMEKNEPSQVVTEETYIRWDRVLRVILVASIVMLFLKGNFFPAKDTQESGVFFVNVPTNAVSGGVEGLNSIESLNSIETLDKGPGLGSEEVTAIQKTRAAVEVLAVQVGDVLKVKVVQTAHDDIVHRAVVDTSVDGSLKSIFPSKKIIQRESAHSEPEALVVTAVKPESIKPPEMKFVDPIIIGSKHIVRAQLTHHLKKGEPVEKLGDTIPMIDDQLLRVYLFTDMNGLKGETLYHDWYLSGKRMARVKVEVNHNRMVASSSKYIDKYMTGDWRVNVTTSKGKSLVSANFNVPKY